MSADSNSANDEIAVTFAGSGDAFGSGGRFQACIHIQPPDGPAVLLDCGATSLVALKRLRLDPNEVGTVFVSHLHGDHFGGVPFLILDGKFSRRAAPLKIVGPPGLTERLRQAMEVMFPGSTMADRRFRVETVELTPGVSTRVGVVDVHAWEVSHPSGAPPLALRLRVHGRRIAYTGDTAWSDAIVEVAAHADLFIAECYFVEKRIPHHLTLATLLEHRDELECDRIVLTHMSQDMLAKVDQVAFEAAYDGLELHI